MFRGKVTPIALMGGMAMTTATAVETGPHLAIQVDTAAEMMSPNPVSIREDATFREALALLTDNGFCAAPVIDAAGRPVGVVSRSDLLVHDRETIEYLREEPEFYHRAELAAPGGERLGEGYQVEKVDRTCVRDMMTPAVFCVAPDAPAAKVIHDMVNLQVHRLFVVDDNGVLVGVISTLDVLRKLAP
jgi:CBS-domain-containing membrane protein